MSNTPSLRKMFIGYQENIDKLLNAIAPIMSINEEIQSLIEGDDEREENLEKFGRVDEFDDSVRNALNDALNTFDESNLNDFFNEMSKLQDNLECYINATGE